ncbi:MAG TPA: ECF transporter S component [Bacillota bacterium]|nr:ECF transporter S component [Bacillota bacterium]HOK68594.1 ECF transporter S component [Bacillota bacterium]HPP84802.1 ECF transporter S component [Bacillota bacterium]
MKKSTILWITRTAVLIALLVVFQWGLGALSGNNQFVVGSAVNLVLIVAATISGLYSGITVAVLSPFLAFVLGIGPKIVGVVPFIALGNLVLVLIWYFIAKNASATVSGYIRMAVALVVGAAVKCAVLYLSIVKIAIPYLLNLKQPQIDTFTQMFGITQFFTAAIGGALALVVVPLLKSAIKTNK